jgi:molybdenum cofactor biosynthesis enzyme MoaA
MDANQVGYVHELEWAEIQKILDDALSIKPRRQLSVQFSGGEPTLSPDFLRAVSYAREVGYFCVQCASNGIRFAQEPEFCQQAKAAGLRLCYLQFDGVTNEANSHRKVGNLFDVKLRAIENLAAAGIDVVLVVTVVNGVNNDQVGKIVKFAIDNADKITVVSFQPCQLHRPRRRHQRRAAASAALHAQSPGPRHARPARRHGAPARLVSALGHESVQRRGRSAARGERRVRRAQVRLPPQLRHRHGPARQQDDEADGAGLPVSER